jgi:hypothetical protein
MLTNRVVKSSLSETLQKPVDVGINIVFRQALDAIFKGLAAYPAVSNRHFPMSFAALFKTLVIDSETDWTDHYKLTPFFEKLSNLSASLTDKTIKYPAKLQEFQRIAKA